MNKKFNLSDINIDNKKIVNEFVRLFKKDKRQQNQRRKFLFSKKQFKIFEKNLQNWLDNSNIKNRYKSLFLGIHYAFAKVYNLDLKKKNIIVHQEHVPFYCEKYLKIFNPKFIFTVRDPRASIAGSILRMQKHNNDKIYSNQFDQIIYTWKYTNFL